MSRLILLVITRLTDEHSMLHKGNAAMGQVGLQPGVVFDLLASAHDLPRLLQGLRSLPDMRMLAVGLLSARYESLCELDWQGAGRRV